MERYTLNHLYTLAELKQAIDSNIDTKLIMSIISIDVNYTSLKEFIASAIYGYFYADLVAYEGDNETDVKAIFINRLCYDIGVKIPYWYRKYKEIRKLLTGDELSLLQTSKVVSSSSDKTNTASGTLQKTATTPTGVSSGTATDGFELNLEENDITGELNVSVDTEGFADKYTNAQQKFANAGKVEGERSGTIEREGSIDDLLKVLEKLPSSFADEMTKELQKHFIFDYEGEERGLYA